MYDEPTAGLDPVASTVVEDLIRSLQVARATGTPSAAESAGVASYIVVTHQHSTIRRAVDRLIFLHKVRARPAWAQLCACQKHCMRCWRSCVPVVKRCAAPDLAARAACSA